MLRATGADREPAIDASGAVMATQAGMGGSLVRAKVRHRNLHRLRVAERLRAAAAKMIGTARELTSSVAVLDVGHAGSLDMTAPAGIEVSVSRRFVRGGGVSYRKDVASDVVGILADLFQLLPIFASAGANSMFADLQFLFIVLGLNFYVTSTLQYLSMSILFAILCSEN